MISNLSNASQRLTENIERKHTNKGSYEESSIKFIAERPNRARRQWWLIVKESHERYALPDLNECHRAS